MKKIGTQWLTPESWSWKFYAAVGIGLLAMTLLGPKGVIHWILLKNEKIRVETRTRYLKEEKLGIEKQLSSFEQSTVSKERAVREELGYLKPDEWSVEFLPGDVAIEKVTPVGR